MNIDERYITKRKISKTSARSRSVTSINEIDENVAPHGTTSKTNRKKVAIKKTPRTTSSKANLIFPVARIMRYLREGRYVTKISLKSCVYLAAVLEYLTAEILDISSEEAAKDNRIRINPRHITLAVRKDQELDKLLSNATISEGGVVPHIIPALLTNKSPRPRSTQNNSNSYNSKNDETDKNEDISDTRSSSSSSTEN